jgi:hypothetical protein
VSEERRGAGSVGIAGAKSATAVSLFPGSAEEAVVEPVFWAAVPPDAELPDAVLADPEPPDALPGETGTTDATVGVAELGMVGMPGNVEGTTVVVVAFEAETEASS